MNFHREYLSTHKVSGAIEENMRISNYKWCQLLTFFLFLSCAHKENPQRPFYYGNLYYQQAGEVKALYHQVYNLAADSLKSKMKKYHGTKACVILDADETILDNSPYQGWLYRNSDVYTDRTWDRWVRSKAGVLLPGVSGFFQVMKDLGVSPFILTNRRSYLIDPTLDHLKALGISLERSQIIGRDKIHSKKERRALVRKTCDVQLLIGDNLSDFSHEFSDNRVDAVQENKEHFGRDYFILPNPMYGDWIKHEGRNGLLPGNF